MFDVFHAEYRIMEEFPDLPVDFHIHYLEGKDLSDFIKPLPVLAFSKHD
jgi:hypothetical protein